MEITSPSTIRQTSADCPLKLINCRFNQIKFGIRLFSDTPGIVRGNVFRDSYERCMSGVCDGFTVERNIFDNTETRSCIFASAQPVQAENAGDVVRT